MGCGLYLVEQPKPQSLDSRDIRVETVDSHLDNDTTTFAGQLRSGLTDIQVRLGLDAQPHRDNADFRECHVVLINAARKVNAIVS